MSNSSHNMGVFSLRRLSPPKRTQNATRIRPAPKNPLLSKLRVALVNPPDPSSSDNARLSQPLGLGYVAAHARERGFHVDIFDLALDPVSESTIHSCGLASGKYSVVGASTYSDNFADTIRLLGWIKSSNPDSVTVLGGYHVTLAPVATLERCHVVDFVICGEGEHPFAKLLQALSGGSGPTQEALAEVPDLAWRDASGAIRLNAPCAEYVDQQELPLPVTDLLYSSAPFMAYTDPNSGREKRPVHVVGSRGCPKRCSFCSIVLINPLWRARSVDSLVAELRLRQQREPFEHVIFQDANALVSPTRALEFSRRLAIEFPGVTWSGTATPDHVVKHQEVIAAIGSLNCRSLEIGIESGNDNTLARFNKGTTVATNEAALRTLELSGIAAGVDFIMFDEAMTLGDLIENARFVRRNELVGLWPPALLFQEVRLYPGTQLRQLHEAANGSSAIHEVPDLIFHDPDVAYVFSAMSFFASARQASLNVLVGDTRKLLGTFLQSCPSRTGALGELAQRAALGEIRLRHVPYDFFEALLTRVADGQASQSVADEVAWGVVNLNVDGLIADGVQLVDELSVAVRALGLEPDFAKRRVQNAAA